MPIFSTLCQFFLLGGLLFTTVAMGAPFRPENDHEILEVLPPKSPQGTQLTALRATLKNDPKQLELALQIAEGYLRMGYSQADPRYDGYAESVLRPWWDQPTPPLSVLLLRARLHERKHDFNRALADLEQVLSRQPRQAQALLSRAVIFQVVGRLEDAQASCTQLLGNASPLVVATCIGSTASLMGKAQKSYRLLTKALAQDSNGSPETRQWAISILAAIAVRLGNLQQGEQHYREALAMDLRDPHSLAAYADLLLDRKQPEKVLELLATEQNIDALLLRLTLAETRLGHPQGAAHLSRLQANFAVAQQRGNRVHLREEARFTLHLLQQPKSALAMAKENWQSQKQPLDARIYMEAALAMKDQAALQELQDWLQQSKLEDQRLAPLFVSGPALP